MNKANKEGGFTEFWLEMDSSNLVLLRQKDKVFAKDYINHKVQVKGKLFQGNIDSDDPKVQSRYGYRLDYIEINVVK